MASSRRTNRPKAIARPQHSLYNMHEQGGSLNPASITELVILTSRSVILGTRRDCSHSKVSPDVSWQWAGLASKLLVASAEKTRLLSPKSLLLSAPSVPWPIVRSVVRPSNARPFHQTKPSALHVDLLPTSPAFLSITQTPARHLHLDKTICASFASCRPRQSPCSAIRWSYDDDWLRADEVLASAGCERPHRTAVLIDVRAEPPNGLRRIAHTLE